MDRFLEIFGVLHSGALSDSPFVGRISWLSKEIGSADETLGIRILGEFNPD